MSKVWLISDTHFQHDKPFIYNARGFSNIHAHDDWIVEQWCKQVKDDDIIYHLGDVGMGVDYKAITNILNSLPGVKYLCIGNHDTTTKQVEYMNHDLFYHIDYQYVYKATKTKTLYLSHFPMMVHDVAKREGKQRYSVCGHTHTKDKIITYGNQWCVNVCIDAWIEEGGIICLDDVLELIELQKNN